MINIKLKKYSKQDYEFIIEHYLDMTSTEIAKKIGCSRQLVLKVWMDNGLKGKDKSRQYYFDFDYFENINSSNKAYLLGLIASDGNLYKRSEKHQGQIQFCLNEQDVDILHKIKQELKSNKPLMKRTNSKGTYYTLTFVSEKMFNDLINIGLTTNKTKTLNVKHLKIPKCYERDFIRGYFDGDGSIVFNSTKSKNIRPCCYSISIAGYVENLLSIQNILSKYNVDLKITKDKRKNKYTEDNIYQFASLRSVSNINTYNFLKTIYYNENIIKFDRKYERAKQFFKLVDEHGLDYRKNK